MLNLLLSLFQPAFFFFFFKFLFHFNNGLVCFTACGLFKPVTFRDIADAS